MNATWMLPWPHRVTTNSLYTSSHTLTHWAQAWADEAIIALRQQAHPNLLRGGKWDVTLDYWPPTEGRQDGDNLEKLTFDTVCRECGVDDSIIWRHTTTRHLADKANPRLEIRIERFSEGE